VVRFPPTWIDASRFETALRNSGGPHQLEFPEVTFEFPTGCKVMVDTAIRLLSLVNQLAFTTRRVRLHFEEGETGTMGYLDRMAFFDHLATEVEVHPARPVFSAAKIHRGSNRNLVEIARINKDARDENLPKRLENVVMGSCRARDDVQELGGAAFLIFDETPAQVWQGGHCRSNRKTWRRSNWAADRVYGSPPDDGQNAIKKRDGTEARGIVIS
jgi:hypothetical protein